jgi:hypothetical protein
MRRILLAAPFIIGLPASIPVIAGELPPNMIYDCEQPDLVPLSKELGRTVCVQYDMIKDLKVAGPAVEAAARASVGHSTKIAASDDPSAITCREHDVAFRSSSLICARNSDWDQRWKRMRPENTAPYAPFASTDGRTPQVAPQ